MRDLKRQECQGMSREAPPDRKAFTCTAAQTRFHISAWGDLHPCHTVRPIKASLLEHKLLAAAKMIRAIVDGAKYPESSKCGSCTIFSQCDSCVGLAHLEGKDEGLMPTDYHCEVTHKTVEHYTEQTP
jgi:radical SAM protein with 4Fe4S-binding SPASM domain